MSVLTLNRAILSVRHLLYHINRDFWQDLRQFREGVYLFYVFEDPSIFEFFEGNHIRDILEPEDIIDPDIKAMVWPELNEKQTELKRYMIYRMRIIKQLWYSKMRKLKLCYTLLGQFPRIQNKIIRVINKWNCFINEMIVFNV